MIKLNKSASVPAALQRQTAPADPSGVDSCRYDHPGVRSALRADQHEKCCYCEEKIFGEGEIEHYRPKKGFTDSSGRWCTPGYYWLTVEWDNLMWACHSCNCTYKKNHFGLVDEAQRDITGKNIAGEEPLLVDPYKDNPDEHIVFREGEAVCRPGSLKGVYTIDKLRLNRTRLIYNRNNAYKPVMNSAKEKVRILLLYRAMTEKCAHLADVLTLINAEIDRLESELRHLTTFMEDDGEFAGMFRHQLSDDATTIRPFTDILPRF